jgi:hypothetical protein
MYDSPLLDESEGLAKFIFGRDGLFTATPQCAGGDISGIFKECRCANLVEELINHAAISERDQVFVMDTSAGWRVIPAEGFSAAK